MSANNEIRDSGAFRSTSLPIHREGFPRAGIPPLNDPNRTVDGRRSGKAFRRGRVDPGGGWFVRRGWRFIDEPLTVFVRPIEVLLARGMHGVDMAVMNLIRRLTLMPMKPSSLPL